MNNLDIRLLRTLFAISESGSFEKGAEKVLRTQAAVSQQMARLEAQLGTRIFERVGRRNELTPAGRRVVEYAVRILNLHDDMLASVQGSEQSRAVRIGVAGDVAGLLLPDMLRQFNEVHSDIAINVVVGGGPESIPRLKDGVFDIAISTRTDQNFRSFPLLPLPVYWIASDGFELPPDRPVPLILAKEPNAFRTLAIEALNRHNIFWVQKVQSPNLVGIRAAVAAGLGLTARTKGMLSPGLSVFTGPPNLPDPGSISFRMSLNPDFQTRESATFFNFIERRFSAARQVNSAALPD